MNNNHYTTPSPWGYQRYIGKGFLFWTRGETRNNIWWLAACLKILKPPAAPCKPLLLVANMDPSEIGFFLLLFLLLVDFRGMNRFNVTIKIGLCVYYYYLYSTYLWVMDYPKWPDTRSIQSLATSLTSFSQLEMEVVEAGNPLQQVENLPSSASAPDFWLCRWTFALFLAML